MADVTAYVDLGILHLLACEANPSLAEEQRAMRRIWRNFEEGHVRLVTSTEETETDIILWLNRRGLCITDTLRAVESIEEFEWWGKADMLVDDNGENIAGALSLGIRTVLVPRPWNRSSLTLAETLQVITRFVEGDGE